MGGYCYSFKVTGWVVGSWGCGFLGLGIMIGFIGVSLGFCLWCGFGCNL